MDILSSRMTCETISLSFWIKSNGVLDSISTFTDEAENILSGAVPFKLLSGGDFDWTVLSLIAVVVVGSIRSNLLSFDILTGLLCISETVSVEIWMTGFELIGLDDIGMVEL